MGPRQPATNALVVALAFLVGACLPVSPVPSPSPGSMAPSATVARASVSPGIAAMLAEALETARSEAQAPGAQAAIVFADGSAWTGASGLSTADVPMTPALLMDLASVTKVYTSTLVLRLAELGVLSLDDPLIRWVPGAANAEGVTLRQLLTHTSGIASDDPALPPVCDPGTCYSYSNSGYGLLGQVIEAATGETYAASLRARVLAPLGLQATFYPGEESVTGEPAMGHLDDAEISSVDAATQPDGPGWRGASGGIVATAGDAARFGHALFTGHVLGEDALRTLVDVDATQGLPGTTECNAQAMLDRRGTPFGLSWNHGGNAGSFRSWLAHYQDAGVTIAVTVNSGALPTAIADALAAVALRDAPAPGPGGRCEDAIAIRSADGTVRHLPDEPGFDGQPAWSPDGRSIAWLTNRADQIDVIVGSADGHRWDRLTNDAAQEVRPSWSPDGSRIAFSSDRDGDHELYAIRVTDGATTKLTDNDVDDWLPTWSPDGRSIAYIRSDASNELRVISADGSSDHAVAGPDGGAWWPAWSPDGARIAYESGGAIWIVAAAGGEPERLAVERLRVVRFPAWAPSADLLFVSDSDLYAVAPDGSNLRRLTETSTEELSPAWAPDGATAAYQVSYWVPSAP